jgi:citrate lyase subunit beta/citryl-CoA lyase
LQFCDISKTVERVADSVRGRQLVETEEQSMIRQDLPVWRSLLFVPVTQRRFVDGSAKRGADAIILDLEDSVAASEKEPARTLVPEVAAIVSRGAADVVVRLNRPLRMTVRDLEAVMGPVVQAVALPKAESAQRIQLVAAVIEELEAERGIPVGTTKMPAMGRDRFGLLLYRRDCQDEPASRRPQSRLRGFRALGRHAAGEAEGLFMPKQCRRGRSHAPSRRRLRRGPCQGCRRGHC